MADLVEVHGVEAVDPVGLLGHHEDKYFTKTKTQKKIKKRKTQKQYKINRQKTYNFFLRINLILRLNYF